MDEIKIPIVPKIDNSELKKQSSKASKTIEKEFEQAGKKAGSKFTEGIKGSFESLKGGDIQGAIGNLTSSLGSAGIAAAGVGVAVAGIASKLYDAIKETQGLQKQVRLLTDLTGKGLVDVTAKVKAISESFDTDFNETLLAANNLSKGMGISIDKALQVIQNGMVNGANASGEFLAQLTEYPRFFKEAGYSAKEMADFIALSTKEGIFSDKGADLVKEFGLRIREMTPATKSALEAIGLSGDELQAQLKSGAKTQKEILAEISNKMQEFGDQSTEVGTVIADVFGGPGEDAGYEFIKMLGNQEEALKRVNKEMSDAQKAQIASIKINEIQGQVIGTLTQAYTEIENQVKIFIADALSGVVEWFKNLWDILKPVTDYIGGYLLTGWNMWVSVAIRIWENIKLVYSIIEALWPILKITLAPAILLVVGAFESLKLVMRLITALNDAMGEGLRWLTDIINKYVNPFIKEMTEKFWEFIKPLKEGVEWVGKFLGIIDDEKEVVKENTEEVEKNKKEKKEITKEAEKNTKELDNNTKAIKKNSTATKKHIPTLDELKKKYISLNNAVEKSKLFQRIIKETKAQKEQKKALDELNKSIEFYLKYIDQDGISTVDIVKVDVPKLKDLGKKIGGAIKGGIEGEIDQIDYTEKLDKILDKTSEFDVYVAKIGYSLLGLRDAFKELNMEQQAVANAIMNISDAFAQTFTDILTGQESFLKGMAKLLLEGVDMVVNAMLAEALAKALAEADSIATFGATGFAKWLAIATLIKTGVAGLKAAIGAEEGTDFTKTLFEHKDKAGSKDTIPLWITPKEARYGILSDKALDVGGRLATNREIAQLMNKGLPAEDIILQRYERQQFNDRNIVFEQMKTNRKLSELNELQKDLIKKQRSYHKFEFIAPKEVEIKEIEYWR